MTKSWVIVSKETGNAIFETFNGSLIGNINTTKYKVVPILEWLCSLNNVEAI